MKQKIQTYLQQNDLAGWLLYDFRGQNPIALHVAQLESSGTRRWFLWIPAEGDPVWLIHAIEGSTFAQVAPEFQGEMRQYVGWQQLETMLGQIVTHSGNKAPRIAMEYSPNGAIPYVSKIDAGIKEMVEASTGAEIVSSADLVQFTQAVLTPEQIASHHRAAAHCLRIKDAAFALIGERLRARQEVTEYSIQKFIQDQFTQANLEWDHGPIVAINAHATDPHYAPTAQRFSPIQEGDMVLIDLWARERNSPADCYADITWTAYCGAEVPADVNEVFQVVAGGRDRAIQTIQSQLDAGEPAYGYAIDDACRNFIEEAGYGDYIIHRTGHSLGTTIHYNGANIDNLETQDRRQLIPGIMFTIEPGIYMPDYRFGAADDQRVGLGIRSEVNCIMHGDRVEVTTLPLQTRVEPLL